MTQGFQLPFAFAFAAEFRFDSFVCAPANEVLLHHLQHSAAKQGQLTWLGGKAGCGKTHLLQAFSLANPEAIYLPMANMLDYGPASLVSLHDSALLVIDDIDLIAGKPEWEEAVFELWQGGLGRQSTLLCAAAAAPAQVGFALADLRSRAQQALVYQVQEPEDATKASILVERAHHRGIELKGEVVQFLLARYPRNLHALMAALDQLDRQALAEQRKLTIPFVKTCLGL